MKHITGIDEIGTIDTIFVKLNCNMSYDYIYNYVKKEVEKINSEDTLLDIICEEL